VATLPLADIRIEPLGLRSIYRRFHAESTLPPVPAAEYRLPNSEHTAS
jgi:hypothetical protein